MAYFLLENVLHLKLFEKFVVFLDQCFPQERVFVIVVDYGFMGWVVQVIDGIRDRLFVFRVVSTCIGMQILVLLVNPHLILVIFTVFFLWLVLIRISIV